MAAEIRKFNITKLPYTVRLGLGSTEPVKRWARFVLLESGDLYWTPAIHLRKDIDNSNIHTSVHDSGKIWSSRYIGSGDEQEKICSRNAGNIGGSFQKIKRPHKVVHSEEYLEPSYLYSGLPTLTEGNKKTNSQNNFVSCLDERLVNSRLYSSLDLVPWTGEDEIIAYLMAKQNQVFDRNDPRCHVFIFCWESVSAVVTMRFTAGDGSIDIQKVVQADEHTHPLKRSFHHNVLSLSESTQLVVKSSKPFPKA